MTTPHLATRTRAGLLVGALALALCAASACSSPAKKATAGPSASGAAPSTSASTHASAGASHPASPSHSPSDSASAHPMSLTITGPNIKNKIIINDANHHDLYQQVAVAVTWMDGDDGDIMPTAQVDLGADYRVTLLRDGKPVRGYDIYPSVPDGPRSHRDGTSSSPAAWYFAPITIGKTLTAAGVNLAPTTFVSGSPTPTMVASVKVAGLSQLLKKGALALILALLIAAGVLTVLGFAARTSRRLDHRKVVPVAVTRLRATSAAAHGHAPVPAPRTAAPPVTRGTPGRPGTPGPVRAPVAGTPVTASGAAVRPRSPILPPVPAAPPVRAVGTARVEDEITVGTAAAAAVVATGRASVTGTLEIRPGDQPGGPGDQAVAHVPGSRSPIDDATGGPVRPGAVGPGDTTIPAVYGGPTGTPAPAPTAAASAIPGGSAGGTDPSDAEAAAPEQPATPWFAPHQTRPDETADADIAVPGDVAGAASTTASPADTGSAFAAAPGATRTDATNDLPAGATPVTPADATPTDGATTAGAAGTAGADPTPAEAVPAETDGTTTETGAADAAGAEAVPAVADAESSGQDEADKQDASDDGGTATTDGDGVGGAASAVPAENGVDAAPAADPGPTATDA